MTGSERKKECLVASFLFILYRITPPESVETFSEITMCSLNSLNSTLSDTKLNYDNPDALDINYVLAPNSSLCSILNLSRK